MKTKFFHNEKLYYVLIVAACALVMAVTIGLTSNCSSLFFIPVSEGIGVPRGSVGVINTVLMISYAGSSMMAGFVYRKFSMMKMFLFCAVLMPVGYGMYAAADQLYQFYLLSLIIGAAEPYVSLLPVARIIGNWFFEKSGTALGIATMGTGIGGMLLGSLSGMWIESLGWRATYLIQALIMLAVLMLTGIFVLREKPADVGFKPYGSHAQLPAEDCSGRSFRQYRFSAVFIITCFATVLHAAGSQTMVSVLEPHLENVGYAASKAALILSVCMGVLAVCKIFFGMLLDKLGIRRVTYLGIVVMVMTFVVSIFARYTVMMLLIFPLMGFACSYITVGIPYLVRKVFGAREYAAFFGVVSALENLGSSVIPTVSGMVYDATSSYVPLFVAAIIFVSFSGMLYTYVFRWVSREKRQAAASGRNS